MTIGQQPTGAAQADLLLAAEGAGDATANGQVGMDAAAAAVLIASAADITLVIDAKGVIRSMDYGAEFERDGLNQFVGRQWSDSVTLETQQKVAALLSEAVEYTGKSPSTKSKWRQVN
ncbi:MAG: hypothetical protein ING33_06830, partial [Rhodocyclaceae bacterium]|nr:hypothetical protein [Rhodocyclaceae bacterium]